MVSIVGSRRHTSYGKQMTYQLSYGLAKAGFTIVSGLALGIDGIAHRAALDAGGQTVAVMAHGLDRIYPSSHRELAKDILAGRGAIISEYAIGEAPLKYRFLERNRLIAALSNATIVTEAAARSGALVTANHAMGYGRIVMAVPGHATSAYSAGPNNLIRSGALPITSVADALVTLGYQAHEATPVSAQNADEATLLALIGGGQADSEQLIESSGLSAAQFANIISLMEITGKVRNLGAGQWMIR